MIIQRALQLALVGSLGVFSVSCASRTSTYFSPIQNPSIYSFPAGFQFGSATSAPQIEKTANSDWDQFVRDTYKNRAFGFIEPGRAKPRNIRKLGDYPENTALERTAHQRLYSQDFEAAHKMGQNAYRFSVSWDVLFPSAAMKEPSPEGIAYYRKLIQEMKKQGLTPWLTLFHFSTPQWFWNEVNGKRGWERDDAVALFNQYVQAVVKEFFNDVDYWVTLNEPNTYIFSSYMEGVFPPFEARKDVSRAALVIENLMKCHAEAYRIIHATDAVKGRTNWVGMAHHTRAFEPMNTYSPVDRLVASITQASFVDAFVDASLTGHFKIPLSSVDFTLPGLRGSEDYIGLNYYGRYYVRAPLLKPLAFEVLMHDPASPASIVNDVGWEHYPQGLTQLLVKTHKKHHKPIYILEHGTADANLNDERRQESITTHLAEILYSIHEKKIDVRGYFHWSLMDNFEWTEGFEAKFGLYSVDFKDSKNYTRTPRKSVETYKSIIDKKTVPLDLWEKACSRYPKIL